MASRVGTGHGVAADEGVPVDGRADVTVDVAIVGGGIAGAALATVLARDGYEVLLLERQTSYRDKVRGEVLLLLGRGGDARARPREAAARRRRALRHPGRAVRRGDRPRDRRGERGPAGPPAARAFPGPWTSAIPRRARALARTAAEAGATVLRGVGDVEVVPGTPPTLRYELDDLVTTVSAGLVVGADGRTSSVRRQLGLALHETSAPHACWAGCSSTGSMVGPLTRCRWAPRATSTTSCFPGHTVAPASTCCTTSPSADASPARTARRGSWTPSALRCLPDADVFRAARPAGPCAFYPMNDTWTDGPCAPGVVLIGDAAGWNDPIIGQGLSIALRDVRMVADVVRAGPDRSVAAFTPYVQERRERMRRLRIAAEVRTALVATFTPAGAARRKAFNAVFRADPVLGGPRLGRSLGPENVPGGGVRPGERRPHPRDGVTRDLAGRSRSSG